ncbi:MAG: hypothetical protein L6R39_006048 [Caloplaca ligustica]|nr:MAG: hypothetical protein L6R39_006048 [Caloplaca ligustica]
MPSKRPNTSSTTSSTSTAPPSSKSSTSATTTPSSKPASASSRSSTLSSSTSSNDPREIALGLWNSYVEKTPQRVKLMDVFMAFLAVVGGLQFLYCVVVGNYRREEEMEEEIVEKTRERLAGWKESNDERGTKNVHKRSGGEEDYANIRTRAQPFNAFLAGFSATVGQFVLTASLRIQTNPENKGEFKSVSHERYGRAPPSP